MAESTDNPASDEPPNPGQSVPGAGGDAASNLSQHSSPSPEPMAANEELDEPLTAEQLGDEAVRNDAVLSWVVLALAALLGCAAINETGVLVQIRSGEYLLRNGLWPTGRDPLSFTTADRSWVQLTWLWEAAVAAVYRVGGAVPLSLIQGALAIAVVWLAGRSHPRGVSTWWRSFLITIWLMGAYSQFTLRPEIVTLLGTAAILTWLTRTDGFGQGAGPVWLPAVLVVIWTNCDASAWIGPALLLLAAVGTSFSETASDGEGGWSTAGRAWLAAGLASAAWLVHPFALQLPAAVISTYSHELPTLRQLVTEPVPANWVIYSALHREFWQLISYRGIVQLLLIAGAGWMLFLNRARTPAAWWCLWLGALALPLLSARELPLASLMSVVLANLAGTAWYSRRFGQEFSLEWDAILLSRGGRLATLLGLFGLCFIALSGRLEGPDGRRVSLGFDPQLLQSIKGLEHDLNGMGQEHSYHFRSSQGDLLIWLGLPSFVDTRPRLFTAGPVNVRRLQDEVQTSLRQAVASRGNPAGDSTTEPPAWKPILDRYRVSRLLVRTTGAGGVPNLATFTALLVSRDWTLTQFGGSVAVFSRSLPAASGEAVQRTEATTGVDGAGPSVTGAPTGASPPRTLDVIQAAFREPPSDLRTARELFRMPTAYEQFVSQPRQTVPAGCQSAAAWVQFSDLLTGRAPLAHRAACLHLAIREAQLGLADNPKSEFGYLTAGIAYRRLMYLEAEIARAPYWINELRYWQSLGSFWLARRAGPLEPAATLELAQLTTEAGRHDLARELLTEALDRLPLSDSPTDSELARRRRLVESREQVSQRVEAARQRLDQARSAGLPPAQLALVAHQEGLTREALSLVQSARAVPGADPTVEKLLATLLFETGEIEAAIEQARSLTRFAGRMDAAGWQQQTSLVAFLLADYAAAESYLGQQSGTISLHLTDGLLTSLPFAHRLGPPEDLPQCVSSVMTGAAWEQLELGDLPRQRLWRGLALVEAGRSSEAIDVFHRLLEGPIEGPVRELARFYVYVLAGEVTDFEAPRDWIPIDADLFAGP